MSRIVSFRFTPDKSVEERAVALLILRPDLSLEEARAIAEHQLTSAEPSGLRGEPAVAQGD